MKNTLVDTSLERVFSELERIDIQNLDISSHTKDYLSNYIDNQLFYKSAYSQLLSKALKKLSKPVSESTFVDYGGGCGMLSYLAKDLGFKDVMYNDIYYTSVADVKTISSGIKIKPDLYCCGDIDELIREINLNDFAPDLICSFDVLEHIYDLDMWMKSISGLSRFSLLFMTGSNPRNPYILKRLKRIHKISEYKGCEKNIRKGDVFLDTSMLKQREMIIEESFPCLTKDVIGFLAAKTRGLRIDGIEKVVSDYINTGAVKYQANHSTNTCDPYTGCWSEQIIDLKHLLAVIKDLNMSGRITNSYYNYSENSVFNVIKCVLNKLIWLSGSESLLLSPALILEVEKQ